MFLNEQCFARLYILTKALCWKFSWNDKIGTIKVIGIKGYCFAEHI